MVNRASSVTEFLGQSPIGEKTSVLLVNEAQAREFRQSTELRPVRLRDEAEVTEFVAAVRKENRSHKLTASLDLVTNGLIHSQLPPTGDVPPVFPYFSRSSGPFQDAHSTYLEIMQDKVTSKSLANLQSQFRSTERTSRPKIVFIVEEKQAAHSTFAKLNSVSDTFYPTPTGVRRIELPDVAANDYERLYFTRYENHRAAALADLPDTDDMRIDFINRLMQIKSQKATLDPTHLLPKLKTLCDKANRRLVTATSENREFWATAWIHSLVEQAYIQESAKLEIQSAIGMLSMIEEQALAAHVLRFSNQVLGTSSEALAYLRRGKKEFESLSPATFSAEMYQPSYFGLLQNLHVTELYQPNAADPGKAEASYRFVKSEGPFFTNLAMLGNAAALGYLTSGETNKALLLYEELRHDNADEIDRWSILCNRLIAMHMYYGEVEPEELTSFAEILVMAEVSDVWKYHILRFALNIIQMDTRGIVSDDMWRLVSQSEYFDELPPGDVIAHQKVIIAKDFDSHLLDGKLGGQMGDFVSKTGFFPSSDFDWT